MCAGVRAAEWDEEERAGICGVERERVDTALCGADPGASTLALSENIHSIGVCGEQSGFLLRCPNSLSHTLFTYKHRGGARGAVPRLRASVLSRTRPLSLLHSPRSVTATRMFRTSTESLAPGHALHPSLPQPTKALSFNPLLSRTRTSSGGAYVQSEVEHTQPPPLHNTAFHPERPSHSHTLTSDLSPVPESMFHLHLGRLCCGRGARLRRSLRHQLVRILLDEHLRVWWWVGRQGMREICEGV